MPAFATLRACSAVLLLGVSTWAAAAPFAIAVDGPMERGDVTTHEIRSGNVVLGFSEFGGGYINKLEIPGIGDVVAREAARFGRGGQVTIRDRLHGGKYNPTQAGFTATAGTHVTITTNGNEATVARRPLSLWHGDGKYDFTEWENLAADPYKNDGGNSDTDGLDEKNLAGKQATEITSEFDLYVQYSDAMRTHGVAIPAFRFYYEFSYIRPPGHAMQQFRPGTAFYRPPPAAVRIATRDPAVSHPVTPTTLSGIILSAVLRGDTAVFDPKAVFVPDAAGKLVQARSPAGAARNAVRDEDDDSEDAELLDKASLVIFASSADPAQGLAIGFMQPNSTINRDAILGRKVSDHSQVYTDSRTTRSYMLGNPRRTNSLWQLGGRVELSGMLSRNEAPAGVYETLRGESFILVGTPAQILQASSRLSR